MRQFYLQFYSLAVRRYTNRCTKKKKKTRTTRFVNLTEYLLQFFFIPFQDTFLIFRYKCASLIIILINVRNHRLQTWTALKTDPFHNLFCMGDITLNVTTSKFPF